MIPDVGHPLKAIAAHGPFLLVVIPLVGALLVRLSARFGDETVRRTAVTNVLLSTAVAVNLLVHFRTESPAGVYPGDSFRFQMASAAVFEAAPAADSAPLRESRSRGDIRIQSVEAPPPFLPLVRGGKGGAPPLLRVAVGVDGLNVWFLLLIPLAMLPAVANAGRGAKPAGRLAALLLLESFLLGVFAALDVVFFLVCLELAMVCLVFLLGRGSAPGERRELAGFTTLQLAGGLLIAAALAASVIAHQWLMAGEFSRHHPPTFSITRVTGELPPGNDNEELSNAYWATLEPLLFALFALGFLLKAAAFPFHRLLCSEGKLPPAFVAIPLYAVWPCIGVYGYLRLAAAICPSSTAAYGGFLSAVLLFGGVYCGLIAASRRSLADVVKYAGVAHVSVAFASAARLGVDGLTAAVFLLISHLGGMVWLLFSTHAGRVESVVGSTRYRLFIVAAAVGLPGFAGFVGWWLCVRGLIAAGSPVSAIAAIAVWVLIVRGLLAADPPAGHAAEQPRAVAYVLPVIFLLSAFGLAPQFVVDRSAGTLKRIARPVSNAIEGEATGTARTASGEVRATPHRSGRGGGG